MAMMKREWASTLKGLLCEKTMTTMKAKKREKMMMEKKMTI